MTIEKLSSRHDAMMRALVLDGLKATEVAAEFGVTDSTLSILRSSPIWEEKEKSLRAEILSDGKRQLEALRGKAVDKIGECLDDTNPRIKLDSAKEILDRTGLSRKMDVEVEISPVINLYIPPSWNHPSQKEKEEKAIDVSPGK